MSNKVIELKKTLLATIAVTNFLENQLQATKKDRDATVVNLYSALVDEVNDSPAI